ncbi:hypothetical protein G6F35_018102 [Rhizopus arrhizus]|nr:hypothetical protein G6F23_015615 [Rhizopus arrhizus]KAG1166592.1 hypothetical protein G6F35_018102 [Rhizopus arrhizus]
MRRLPLRKAPGSDHLRTEMLIPIRKQLAAILARLFDICCQWSYTPSLWRHAQKMSRLHWTLLKVVSVHSEVLLTKPSACMT